MVSFSMMVVQVLRNFYRVLGDKDSGAKSRFKGGTFMEKEIKPVDIKVGDIVYPHFNRWWAESTSPAWRALHLQRANPEKAPAEFFCRARLAGSITGSDARMDGKWMSTVGRSGLVVFVQGAKVGENSINDPDQDGVILATDPVVYGLRVKKIFKSSALAEVVPVELP
jgi:hypothetical protein